MKDLESAYKDKVLYIGKASIKKALLELKQKPNAITAFNVLSTLLEKSDSCLFRVID